MIKSKISFLLAILITSLVTFQACKKTEYMAVGTPFSHFKGIQGTYKLKKVVQVDEVTSSINNILDVSDLYLPLGGTPMAITFADSMVSLNAGDTPVNYFSVSSVPSKWRFDDATAPSYVIIPNSTGNDSIKLLNPVREPFEKALNVVITRRYTPAKKKSVSYQFFFEE